MGNIVLVGVGGAGMSGVARLFLGLGFSNIVGIDSTESELTLALQEEGIKIMIGSGQYEIQPKDYIIFSSAATQSTEIQQAKKYFTDFPKKYNPPLTYFQFLGELSKYFRTIAVAGTHGKSTTSALLASSLHSLDSNFGLGIVGAGLADWDGLNMNFNQNHKEDIKDIVHHIVDPKGPSVEHLMGKYNFVIEACEYNYQFLSLNVDTAVITNIELDHADVYGTFENYLDTFVQFCMKIDSQIIALENTQGLSLIKDKVHIPIDEISIQQFNFTYLLGSHNHANASLAYHVATKICDSEPKKIKKSLEDFTGLWRRGELLTENSHGVPIISDYAHHPTELKSTLQAVKEKYLGKPIKLIFQPHQARRVVEFWDEFIDICGLVEETIIYHIYTAREKIKDIEGYNIVSKHLIGELDTLKTFDDLGQLFVKQFDGTYVTDFQDIKKLLDSQSEGVILICTAGDLDREVRKNVN